MYKLIVSLISLSMILACHSSCEQCDENLICSKCIDPNSDFDEFKKTCLCKENYYTSSLNPFTCSELILGDEENACEINISLYASSFKVKFLSYYDQSNTNNVEQNNVVTEITVDTSVSGLSNFCRQYLVTKMQYSPYSPDQQQQNIYDTYIDFPEVYVQPFNNKGDLKITIPLIKVYELIHFPTEKDQDNIKQQIWIQLMLGHSRSFLRAHTCIVHIFTHRDQIQTFEINVDKQRTEDCKNDCIVIADLDTGKQVTKSDYQTPVNTSTYTYTVGDTFYAKIFFLDATYKKQLEFVKLAYKTDDNEVYDFSYLTQYQFSQSDHSLHISLKLVLPTTSATIQVRMLISQLDGRRRFLAEESQAQIVEEQFVFSVLNSPTPIHQSHIDQSNGNLILLFTLLNLLSISIFF